MVVELDDMDAVAVVLGLLLMEELLFRSRYDPDVQADLKNRAHRIIEQIHRVRNDHLQNNDPP